MNKKPSVFVNKIERDLKNNEKVYYSKNETTTAKGTKKTSKSIANNDINRKIITIFASPTYVYKAEVKITLKSGTVIKKIVGKNRNYLITMDNELIPISDILDIEKL